jgi:O-antigen ligase
MPWSKAGLSIGMGLLLVASLLHRQPLRTFRTPIGWASVALMAPLLLSALRSHDLRRGWGEWTAFWPILFLFFGAAAVRDTQRPDRFLWIVLGSTSLATLPSLLHLMKQLSESGELLGKLDPATNIWLYTLAIGSGATIAALLAIRARTLASRTTLTVTAAVHLVAMLATQRRALTLITVVALAAAVGLAKKPARPLRLWLGIATGLFLTLVAAYFLDPRIRELAHPSALFTGDSSRALMWEFALDRYRENPVIGMGLGDLRDALHAHADEVELRIRIENRSLPTEDRVIVNLHHAHCHSNFLHTMAVAGTAGLIGVIIWLLVLPSVLIRRFSIDRASVTLGLTAWTYLFFGGLTDSTLYSSNRLSAFSLIFAFAWGMLLRATPAPDCPPPPDRDAALN